MSPTTRLPRYFSRRMDAHVGGVANVWNGWSTRYDSRRSLNIINLPTRSTLIYFSVSASECCSRPHGTRFCRSRRRAIRPHVGRLLAAQRVDEIPEPTARDTHGARGVEFAGVEPIGSSAGGGFCPGRRRQGGRSSPPPVKRPAYSWLCLSGVLSPLLSKVSTRGLVLGGREPTRDNFETVADRVPTPSPATNKLHPAPVVLHENRLYLNSPISLNRHFPPGRRNPPTRQIQRSSLRLDHRIAYVPSTSEPWLPMGRVPHPRSRASDSLRHEGAGSAGVREIGGNGEANS